MTLASGLAPSDKYLLGHSPLEAGTACPRMSCFPPEKQDPSHLLPACAHAPRAHPVAAGAPLERAPGCESCPEPASGPGSSLCISGLRVASDMVWEGLASTFLFVK